MCNRSVACRHCHGTGIEPDSDGVSCQACFGDGHDPDITLNETELDCSQCGFPYSVCCCTATEVCAYCGRPAALTDGLCSPCLKLLDSEAA